MTKVLQVKSLLICILSLLSIGAMAIDLQPAPADALWATQNSRIEAVDGVYRWHLEAGQSAELAIRADHPLLGQLRYYDYLTFEVRIVSGDISSLGLKMLGNVSGPRQYKVHDWKIAVMTTEKLTWYRRCFELSRPNWFPWDDVDGQGTDAFFRFQGLALSPDTVVEIRGLTMTRGMIRLKPDYLPPITWPTLSRDEAGNAVLTLQQHVLNQANRPLDIEAELISKHAKFAVTIAPDTAAENIKNGQPTTFTIKAVLSKADEAALPELYAEPLTLAFRPKGEPEATIYWQGNLVRPLSDSVRSQVLLAPDDLALIREKLPTDTALRSLIKPEKVIAEADLFLTKELLRIPTGHLHVSNNWVGDWRPSDRMPEAVNTKTGEKQFDTAIAARTWKEYLAHRGQALNNLADAYLYTGDEKYAKKAIELFALYAQQYTDLSWADFFSPRWSDGDSILASTRVALSSSYGTNWYFKGHCRLLSAIADSPSWDAKTRQTVYSQFILPYATELMKFQGGISNMTDITNHNLLLIGLAFRDAGLVRWALYSDPGLLRRLEDISPDGFSSEGRPLNYHFAAMSEYLPALSYLNSAQLPINFPKARLEAAMRMPLQRANLEGYVPSTGDSARGWRVGPRSEADWLVGMFPGDQWIFDLGRMTTVQSQLHAYRTGTRPSANAWKSFLETSPRLFKDAGYAILRSGDTAETQIMATLDYGRNPMHAHLDRNAISLSAFGHLYAQGPGSMYNVGSGGMTRQKELEVFVKANSLSQNVILVDQEDQAPAIGELVAWDPQGDRQVVVGRVNALRPGVDHIRALVHTQGLIIVVDRLICAESHAYDFVYHNYGDLALGAGWSGTPVAAPIGKTASYESLADLQKLSGSGPVHLQWNVAEGAHLALWQPAIGDVYTATMALNNIQTKTMPQATPTLIHRITGTTVTYVTVLEPYRDTPRVSGLTVEDDTIHIALQDTTLSIDTAPWFAQ